MIKHFKYLWYVIKHKHFVFIECCKLGIPWRGVLHDWHKFSPSEWFPYVEKFYGGVNNKAQFKMAWFHHQKYGRHHWQWHCMPAIDGSIEAMPMTQNDLLEMMADWKGAGRAQGNTIGSLAFYKSNKDKMILHPDSRQWIESYIGYQRGEE